MKGTQHRPSKFPFRRLLASARLRLLPLVSVLLIIPFLVSLTAAPANAVFNGIDPVPSQFGFAVKILTVFPGNHPNGCSGALIYRDVVLTDAHCVRDPQYGYAASVDVTFHFGQPGAYTVSARAYPKPSYVMTGSHHDDVAVLLLDRWVTNEPTIPLATTEPPKGAQVVQAGYGCESDPQTNKPPCYVDNFPSWTLKGMESSVDGDNMCKGIDGPSQFCTVSRASSTNSGDSGGPVIWLDHGVRKLVGLTEGHPQGVWHNPKYRMMETSIAYELPWIKMQAELP